MFPSQAMSNSLNANGNPVRRNLGGFGNQTELTTKIQAIASHMLRWNPSDGIQKANAHLKQSPRANSDEYKLCIQNSRDELSFRASILEERAIYWRFSVEANRVCFYKNCDRPFSMQFNESCIALPVRRLSPLMLRNTLWSNVRSDKPTHAFLHPHSMSFNVDVDFLTGQEKV